MGMQPKRWLGALGGIVFAIVVALGDIAMTWPKAAPQPAKPVAPTGALGVGLAEVAHGLDEPVAIAFTPIVTDTRMFVVERAGVIRIVQSGNVANTPFLDIHNTVDS